MIYLLLIAIVRSSLGVESEKNLAFFPQDSQHLSSLSLT